MPLVLRIQDPLYRDLPGGINNLLPSHRTQGRRLGREIVAGGADFSKPLALKKSAILAAISFPGRDPRLNISRRSPPQYFAPPFRGDAELFLGFGDQISEGRSLI